MPASLRNRRRVVWSCTTGAGTANPLPAASKVPRVPHRGLLFIDVDLDAKTGTQISKAIFIGPPLPQHMATLSQHKSREDDRALFADRHQRNTPLLRGRHARSNAFRISTTSRMAQADHRHFRTSQQVLANQYANAARSAASTTKIAWPWRLLTDHQWTMNPQAPVAYL